jgi:hypothetical protein
LGGRLIRARGFNIEQCEIWLRTCRQLHGPVCDPEFTDELRGVRLLDVNTKTIVPYPGSPCDYAALSYVWGGVEQRHYQVGSRLEQIPLTIEHALECAVALRKQYLWVDSLCIDQSDADDKADQIKRMWSIYRGASILACRNFTKHLNHSHS